MSADKRFSKLSDMEKGSLRLLFGRKQYGKDHSKIKTILHRNRKNMPVGSFDQRKSRLNQTWAIKLLDKNLLRVAAMSTDPRNNSLLTDFIRVADPENKKAVASWNFRNNRNYELVKRLHENNTLRNDLLEIISPDNPQGLELVIVANPPGRESRINLLLVNPKKYKNAFYQSPKRSNSSPTSKKVTQRESNIKPKPS